MKKLLTCALLLALVLSCAVARADGVRLTEKQRYNFNLFLSNFTEQGFCLDPDESFDDSDWDERMLTEFAIEHCWFNRQNRLEWGEYFNYNNVRLPESQIEPVVWKYFGLSIRPSHDLEYIDYRNGYYYWEETGGHTSDGFACITGISHWDYDMYYVTFEVFGSGYNWNNDACYYTPEQAERRYPLEDWERCTGYAIIATEGDLDSRDEWSLCRYDVDPAWD